MLRDVYLERAQAWADTPVLAAPGGPAMLGHGEWEAPASPEEYLLKTSAWPLVIGVVKEGTVLRLKRVMKFSGGWLYHIAEIQSGEYRGQEANLYDLSLRVGSSAGMDLRGPEPRLLKLVGPLEDAAK